LRLGAGKTKTGKGVSRICEGVSRMSDRSDRSDWSVSPANAGRRGGVQNQLVFGFILTTDF